MRLKHESGREPFGSPAIYRLRALPNASDKWVDVKLPEDHAFEARKRS
jgi:hypothetical protein